MRNNGFAFDTWGFLTVENALTPEQVTANRPVDAGLGLRRTTSTRCDAACESAGAPPAALTVRCGAVLHGVLVGPLIK